MVEERANLDYGADDTSLEDDLTHIPAPVGDEAIVTEEVVVVEVDEVVEEENPEASTYGAP
jgi:hypothetical protein